MAIYVFCCQECGNEHDVSMPMSEFRRKIELTCDDCADTTTHQHVPRGGMFACKGSGFPSYNQRLKDSRKKKSSNRKQVVVERERAGEGVSKISDLKKKT